MGDGSTDSADEPPPPRGASSGSDDTIPASEPPVDLMRASRASIPPIPTQRYRHGVELGRGGMGRVVEAFDTQLGRMVALKEVLPKGEGVARRFVREIEITARLEHASIVPIYDSGTTPDGRPFYVMRRVTGRPLDELIRRARDLGERLTLLPAMLAAIDAVAHAHRRGVIHRDLKPANILVGDLGETVVIDWGLAKVIDEADEAIEAETPLASDSLQTQVGSVFGTPGFMAPEQARGEELSTAGDVYALGATLYHLLAGKPPHAGASATDVIGRTLVDDVVPLATAAPGAPPELAAIVDKALSFEATTRYPDAGTLGEDVRRFLAGQLVAAHRYTPRQRLGRFARRHRTVLAIAALASVAVAALAWFSVHQIVEERDHATEARRAAVADKRAAEAARDRLAERNDALLVTQARAVLDSNPTMAAALLKQLAPTSTRLADARAVAQAAVSRGVWWGIQSTSELTTAAELSPDGHALLQISADGMLRVWDLVVQRLVVARKYPRGVMSTWVAGGRVLVRARGAPPELLTPSTHQTEPLALAPLAMAEASADGTRVIVVDEAGVATVLEVATKIATPIAISDRVVDTAIAADGAWHAVMTKQAVVVFDRAGNELTRLRGEWSRLVASAGRRLAVIGNRTATECRLEATVVCMALTLPPASIVIDTTYRGDVLILLLSGFEMVAVSNGRIVPGSHPLAIGGLASRLVVAGDRAVLGLSGDGKLAFYDDVNSGVVTLPSPVPRAKLVGRPGLSRVAVVGDGLILGLELDAIIPRRLPAPLGTNATFIDEDTVIGAYNDRYSWIDVATGKSTPIEFDANGMSFIDNVDTVSGRAVIRMMGTTPGLYLFRRGAPPRQIVTGPKPWARLVPGDAVLFGVGETEHDGRIFIQRGTAEPEELVKLDGSVEAALSIGGNAFVAISERGEVVRGDLTSGVVERQRVKLGKTGYVTGDGGHRVVFGEDRLVMKWDDQLTDLATFDKDVAFVQIIGDQLLVILADFDVHLMPLAGGASRRLLAPGAEPPQLSADGRTLVGLGTGREFTVVELEGQARWTLPLRYSAPGQLTLAPTSRRMVHAALGALMVWTLPSAPVELGGWLDEQTTAVVVDEVLTWPWQRTPGTPGP